MGQLALKFYMHALIGVSKVRQTVCGNLGSGWCSFFIEDIYHE